MARLENIIDSFQNNNETYTKMIKQAIETIISNPRRLLQLALVSIFESARKHPRKLHAMYYNGPATKIMRRSSLDICINQSVASLEPNKSISSEFWPYHPLQKKLKLIVLLLL